MALHMSKSVHILYVLLLAAIVTGTLIFLSVTGWPYYRLGIEDRFFHSGHESLKPSGSIGHGLGILGSLLMMFGVALYMVRKRVRRLGRLGQLKYWLEFHIFLCSLGPILVLFHTSFKFGGIVAISFWSMAAVFLSGIIGRFIYIQIPRTIEGRELSLNEVRDLKTNLGEEIRKRVQLDETSHRELLAAVSSEGSKRSPGLLTAMVLNFIRDSRTDTNIRSILRKHGVAAGDRKMILRLVKSDRSLNRKIERLVIMQNIFKYWHVAHLPFALVMLVIMIIHVAVTLAFGYHWIF